MSGFASGAASFCHCDSLTPQLSYKAHAGIISHAPDVRVDCNLESTICHNHEVSRLYDYICVRNTPRRLEAEVQVVYMVFTASLGRKKKQGECILRRFIKPKGVSKFLKNEHRS